MKICRVVPILDTVGHMTNYTWIGPAVIVNSIKILFAIYSLHSWSGAALGIQIDGAKIFVQNEISKIGTKPY